MEQGAVFKAIKNTRVSDKVLAQIKDAIFSGRYQPGEKLPSERELIQSFSVSRAVIREAVRSLELTGIVTVRQGPTGGAFVNDLSLENVSNAYLDLFNAGKFSAKELLDVRLHIEPEVARQAAMQNDPHAKGILVKVYEEETNPTDDHREWVRQNLQVHYVLSAICGNRFFQALLDPILKLTEQLILVVKPTKINIHHHQEHAKIVDCVISGNGDEAAIIMAEHVNKTTMALADLERKYRRRMGLPIPEHLKELAEQSNI